MPFEPVYENIAVCRQTLKTEEKNKAECRTEIPTDSVSGIINLYAQSVITEKDVSEGKLKYSGKVTFFLCYENSGGEISKCECGADFSGEIALPEGCDCRCVLRSDVEKAEADASGVRLNIIAYISVKAEIYSSSPSRALCRGEGLIVKEEEIPLIKSSGIRECGYPIEEEIELNFKVAQVISQRAQATVTAVQCGVGAIIVDGEAFLSVVMLQSGAKNDIIREDKVVPFRAEIECEEAMPASKAVARVFVRSFKTDIFVDEENGVSRLNASALIKCEGEAFSEETKSFAEDAFDPSLVIETEREKVTVIRRGEVKSEKARVSERVAVDEIPMGAYLAATCGEKAEIASAEKSGEFIIVSGALSLNALILDADGKVFSRRIETPFECKIAGGNAERYTVTATATESSAKIVSATETEVAFDVIFTVYPEEESSYELIKDVKSAGEKQVNDHAISVYLALENEDLWGLSKRLGAYPQTLLETNPDLQFPLTGKERIIVYRQK